jgi:hypothetical protein
LAISLSTYFISPGMIQADSLKANQPTTNGRAGTHCTDNRNDRWTAYTGDLSKLPGFLLYARTHARTYKYTWFTITGTHAFTTSGTGTLMSQNQLHRTVSDNITVR